MAAKAALGNADDMFRLAAIMKRDEERKREANASAASAERSRATNARSGAGGASSRDESTQSAAMYMDATVVMRIKIAVP
jgi:hypothetical protein